jgi:predicted nuclease with TOPRIM domain
VGKEEDRSFYVRLEEPVHLRKEVLLARKQALQILHKNERLKLIRKEKALFIEELRKKLRDVYYFNNKLRSLLPVANTKAIKRIEPEKKKIARDEPEPEDAVERELSHIEKIEQELRDIEGRLDKF